MQNTCVDKMQEFLMLNLAVYMNILTAGPRGALFLLDTTERCFKSFYLNFQ